MATVVRKFQDDTTPEEVIMEGVTVAEAKDHCSDPSSSGDGWFDVFYLDPDDE